MIVYYSLFHVDGDNYMVTTAKDYWDKHHRIDDGFNNVYFAIEESLFQCGLERSDDSVYFIDDGIDIDKVIQVMKTLGFELQTNPDFEAFLLNH